MNAFATQDGLARLVKLTSTTVLNLLVTMEAIVSISSTDTCATAKLDILERDANTQLMIALLTHAKTELLALINLTDSYASAVQDLSVCSVKLRLMSASASLATLSAQTVALIWTTSSCACAEKVTLEKLVKTTLTTALPNLA